MSDPCAFCGKAHDPNVITVGQHLRHQLDAYVAKEEELALTRGGEFVATAAALRDLRTFLVGNLPDGINQYRWGAVMTFATIAMSEHEAILGSVLSEITDRLIQNGKAVPMESASQN